MTRRGNRFQRRYNFGSKQEKNVEKASGESAGGARAGCWSLGLDALTKSTLGILSVPARKSLRCVWEELNLNQNAEGVSGEAWEVVLRHLYCQEAIGSHKLVLCKVT